VFEDAIFEDRVSTDEMEYWFSKKSRDDFNEEEYLEFLEEVEDEDPHTCARHEGEGRKELSAFQPRDVVVGQVVEVSTWHGLMVDIGAEYDVLVPIDGHRVDWKASAGRFDGVFDETFQVEIAQVKDPHRFRWPLVGKLVDGPELPGQLDPYSLKVPIFMYADDEIKDVSEEVGRGYIPAKFYVDFRDPDPTVYPELVDEAMERPTAEKAEEDFMNEVARDIKDQLGLF